MSGNERMQDARSSRAWTSTTRSEFPPRSKKFSFTPISSGGRSLRARWRRSCAPASVRGGAEVRRRDVAERADKARRSTLPLPVSGKASRRKRNRPGSCKSGSVCRRNARSSCADGTGHRGRNHVGDEFLAPVPRLRARAPTASRTASCRRSAVSISPSSIR